MNAQIEALRQNTDRRFAILMTGLQDFMAAYQQERQQTSALLGIQEKATPTPPKPETAKQKKKRLVKEAKERNRLQKK